MLYNICGNVTKPVQTAHLHCTGEHAIYTHRSTAGIFRALQIYSLLVAAVRLHSCNWNKTGKVLSCWHWIHRASSHSPMAEWRSSECLSFGVCDLLRAHNGTSYIREQIQEWQQPTAFCPFILCFFFMFTKRINARADWKIPRRRWVRRIDNTKYQDLCTEIDWCPALVLASGSNDAHCNFLHTQIDIRYNYWFFFIEFFLPSN